MNKVDDIQKQVEVVAKPWVSSPYYEDAERWTHLFWSNNSLFYNLFSKLNCENVVELACGHGRHSEIVAEKAGKLALMDVVSENITFCKERLSNASNVSYFVNDGLSFSPIPDSSVTAIFCYDAMVHFSPDIVRSYIVDAARVLMPGGMALFHHSNYSGEVKEHYGLHPHARNYLDFEQFQKWVKDCGLNILDSVEINWGGVQHLDRLTLLVK